MIIFRPQHLVEQKGREEQRGDRCYWVVDDVLVVAHSARKQCTVFQCSRADRCIYINWYVPRLRVGVSTLHDMCARIESVLYLTTIYKRHVSNHSAVAYCALNLMLNSCSIANPERRLPAAWPADRRYYHIRSASCELLPFGEGTRPGGTEASHTYINPRASRTRQSQRIL